MSPAQQTALTKIAEASVLSERKTGLPAELTAAQCIFESGWLTVCPGNNCFGIKVHADDQYASGQQYCLTSEYINGEWVKEPLAFEQYETLEACFDDHANLILTEPVYQPAWLQFKRDQDLAALIVGIGQHYGTDPQYSHKILSMTQQGWFKLALQKARVGLGTDPAKPPANQTG